jgi:hypothetical protein
MVLSNDRRGNLCRISMAHVLLPSVPPIRIGRSAQGGSASWRIDIELDPIAFMPAMRAESAVCEAGAAVGRAYLKRRLIR